MEEAKQFALPAWPSTSQMDALLLDKTPASSMVSERFCGNANQMEEEMHLALPSSLASSQML
jgi:hypothetical protein